MTWSAFVDRRLLHGRDGDEFSLANDATGGLQVLGEALLASPLYPSVRVSGPTNDLITKKVFTFRQTFIAECIVSVSFFVSV